MTYIINSGKIWKPFQSDLFEGFSPFVEAKEGVPGVRWRGAKIPVTTWHTIIAFFLAHKEHEVQVRLYYNPVTREWMPHAFPQQYGTGMTTRELPDHAHMAIDLAIFGDPWLYMGTVHHHCSAGAFQSGTDKSNEETIVGLHMTVGHLGQAKLDLHSRVSMKFPGELDSAGNVIRPGIQHFFENVVASDWFEIPSALATMLPVSTHNEILMALLKAPVSNEVGFPARWSENLIRFQQPTYTPTTWPRQGGEEWEQFPRTVYAPSNHRLHAGGGLAGQGGARWDHELPPGSFHAAQGHANQQGGGTQGPAGDVAGQLEIAADEQWTLDNITARSEPVIHPSEGICGYDFDLKYLWQWIEFESFTAAATFLAKHGYTTTKEGTWCTTESVAKINAAYDAQKVFKGHANQQAIQEAYENEGGANSYGVE